jgi:thiamine kinase-like enzyme
MPVTFYGYVRECTQRPASSAVVQLRNGTDSNAGDACYSATSSFRRIPGKEADVRWRAARRIFWLLWYSAMGMNGQDLNSNEIRRCAKEDSTIAC